MRRRSCDHDTIPNADRAERDDSIDTLRGATILAVVAYHSIDRAHHPSAASLLGYLFQILDPLIMPVFAGLAGYVYAARPLRRGQLRPFTADKVRRLLVPFLATASLLYLLRLVSKGPCTLEALAGIWRAYAFSYAYLWFLQSLFGVFMICGVLDQWNVLGRLQSWALALLLSFLAIAYLPGPSLFSVWGIWYLLPSFLVGYGARRYSSVVLSRPAQIAAAALLTLGLVALHATWWGWARFPTGRMGAPAMAAGLGLSLVLLRWRRPERWSARLGLSSYAVYLYQGIGLALASRAGARAQLGDGSNFVLSVCLGVIVALGMEAVMKRFRLGRLALGLR